ncbi:SPOR domain-containing protein [Lentibacillus lipolyticus]|nr:SPOR domain-containing protein [Lentibacillus lipolyticus]
MGGIGLGKKGLFVWLNGHKARLKHKHSASDEKYSIKEFRREQAAAVDDPDIPELIRRESEDGEDSYFLSGKSKLKPFKPFLFASLSAIIIGSVLGFFMLHLFVDIDKGMSQQYSVPASDDQNADEADSEQSDNAVSAAAMEAESAFVLQAGKFSEKANADTMAENFRQAGFDAMTWEKNDYFFVLAGIADSKDQAAQFANEFKEAELEVYVKEWHVPEKEVMLDKHEKEWLQLYRKQWEASLESISNGDRLSAEKWEKVVDAIPEKPEHIKGLTAAVREEYQQIGQAGKWQDQKLMLVFLKQYSRIAPR